MRSFSVLLASLTFAAVAATAQATAITYDFSVTATGGPLMGDSASGFFTYDSASIVPAGNDAGTGFLTALDFTWDGITYSAATANTGLLAFDGGGNLVAAIFGTNCGAGFCNVTAGHEQWSLTLTNNFTRFTYSTPSDAGFDRGSANFAPAPSTPAPEPLTLSLFAAGLAGLAARRRRKASVA